MDPNVQGRAKRVVPRVAYLLLGALAVFVAALMYLYIERQEDDLERHLAATPNAGHPTDSSELAERERLPGGARNVAEGRTQKDDLARRLTALRAAGHPTNFSELAEREKLPDGAKNAAEVYMEASAVFVFPAEGAHVPVLGHAELPDLGAPLPESMAKAIEKYLQSNSRCLSLLHEAGAMEHCRFDRDDRGKSPSWDDKMCIQLLNLSALYRADQGDSDAAIARIKDALRLCDVLPDEPALIGHVLRTAGVGFSLGGVERILNVTSLTERQLIELDQACALTATSLDIVRAMNVERCIIIESWTNPKITTEKYPALVNILGATDKALLFSLDYMADCIEAVALPTSQRLARMDEIDRKLEELEARIDEIGDRPEDPSFVEAIAALTVPAARRVVELDLFCRADVCTTRTALAVERYRLANNSPPETLQRLVPKYLDNVPMDPFDGKPIRYRRTQPGYVVYSVWRDGRDNGGVRRGDVSRGEPYDSPFIALR